MSCCFRLAIVLVMFVVSGCSAAPTVPPLAIGSQVDFNLLEDQRGNPFIYQDAMNAVLFVNSMKGNALIRETLADVDIACMTEGRVVYLADISGMPSLISSLIAVPRMRSYPYPVWLDRDGLATIALPVEEDKVTVLTLKQSAIVAVAHLQEQADLRRMLLAQCGPARQQVAAHGEE